MKLVSEQGTWKIFKFDKISFKMAENKLHFVECASIHTPLMFCGLNYPFWKIRMLIFMESIDKGIWDAIVNIPYTLKCLFENK